MGSHARSYDSFASSLRCDLPKRFCLGLLSMLAPKPQEYLNHLHLSWKWDAFYKLEAKLDRLQFDLSMPLGREMPQRFRRGP